MSAEELQNSNKEKAKELFENGTGVDRSSKDLEPNDKGVKKHDEAGSSVVVVRSSFKVGEAAKNKSNLLQARNCCAYLKQAAVLIWIERVFLISICVAVAVGFTVPIIIYAVDTDRGSDNSTLSIDLYVDNCPSFDMQVC